MEERKDFATTGAEVFKVGGKEPSKERIVLNIQEEAPGIVLDKKKNKLDFSDTGFMQIWKKFNDFLISHSKVKVKDKATFFHLLSVMINSGIPMLQALKSLIAQLEKNPRLQLTVEDLYTSIESGNSLSEAMLASPNVFSEADVGMVEAGEASGQLAKVLENIAEDTEKAYSIRSKVKGAMMYPMVIMVLLVLVVGAMMIYVIPKLTELFTSVQGELPLITRIVVGTSDFMINRWAVILAAVVGFMVFIILFKKTTIGRYVIDDFKLHIPIFGKLLQQAYLSRFARSLSSLIDSNVSIVETLQITANSMGNEVYRKRLLLAMEDIKQGIPLAENLTASNLFPPMLVNMIEVGERTAQLGEITSKVAAFYESEVDTAVAGLSKIIEPIILVIIGLTVGTVVASIMLPIMKLSSLSGAL